MTSYKADIVVLSNVPKNLGPDIEVVLGTPTKDPWSLPFGYKPIFADRADSYDLFIYSEDDTLVTERNVGAFVSVTQILPEPNIAGFIRFEVGPDGKKYYSTLHAHYHWDPHSVVRVADFVFARYTNDHSGCFILTRDQLKKCIVSGGFMKPARKERLGMLETAATDPYTQCGMRKLVCISHLNDFCLHHLPNVYLGRIGVDADLANREIERLKSLDDRTKTRGPLFDTRTLLESDTWNKAYYESSRQDIISLVPAGVKRVLSVGCGCGSTESELVKKGIEVTAIPLDGVLQVTAEAKGIKTVPPDFAAAFQELRGQQFDCILISDVLHHLPTPVATLRDLLVLLADHGSIVISVPNFAHASILRSRWLGHGTGVNPSDGRSFEKYRLHFTTSKMLRSWLKLCGLEILGSRWQIEPKHEWLSRLALGKLNNPLSRRIVVSAGKPATASRLSRLNSVKPRMAADRPG